MRNRIVIVLVSFVLILTFVTSCRKENSNTSSPTNHPNKVVDEPLITAARDFFGSNVLNSPIKVQGILDGRQKLIKTPDWSNAYILRPGEKDIVVVPLKFNLPMSFNLNKDDTRLPLVDQEKLFIYKDLSGRYMAEVVIYIPNKEYQEHKLSKFSGVIMVEDWAGNSIEKILYDGTKSYRLTPQGKNGGKLQTDSDCYIINWYLCDVDEVGATYNCEYVYTEEVGSCNMSLEPCLEGCGETYLEDDQILVKPTAPWVVGEYSPFYEAVSKEEFTGKKVATEPQGGHFISMRHLASYFEYSTDIHNTWTEVTSTATLDNPRLGHAYVTGTAYLSLLNLSTSFDMQKTFGFAGFY